MLGLGGYNIAISKAENEKQFDVKRTITIREIELVDLKAE
jgi:hypothetical protein